MKGFQPDKFAKTARLPVKVNQGVCTLIDGTPLPKLKPDTTAELLISPWDIINADERAQLLQETRVEFLPAETSVWARVKDANMPTDLLLSCRRKYAWPKTPGQFVEVRLESRVLLVIRGDGRATLSDCSCKIPALPDQKCSSINEAYTRVSESFEPSRRSHTGNIFNCVFYEVGSSLFPLRKLRDEKLSTPDSESPAI